MNTLEFFNLTFEKESVVEIFLRNCSFLTLFLSMMFYWIQTAFSSTVTYGNSKSPTKFHQFFITPFYKKGGVVPLTNFGTITMIISNILLMFLLVFRWIESGHFPLSNLYESLMFLSWSCSFIHLILEFKTEIVRPDATLFMRSIIGSITSPSALFTNAFATFSLPPEMQKASPLVPALQSNWLMMHVTVMIISYSALILGSLLSIAFLILIRAEGASPFSINEKQKKRNNPLTSVRMPTSIFANAPSFPPSPSSPPHPLPPPSGGEEVGKGGLAWNFDNLSYRVLGIGFPFLTIGILSGAVWANEAWGSYWVRLVLQNLHSWTGGRKS